jgi:hypothetical protein
MTSKCAVVSGAPSAAALPTGETALYLGQALGGGNMMNGPVARAALWNTVALTGPQLSGDLDMRRCYAHKKHVNSADANDGSA